MSKIDKSNVKEIFPLISIQQGMLFHYINHSDENGYFIQIRADLNGALDVELFQKTWQLITEKNEALRTMIRWSDLNQPIQIVLKEYQIPIEFIDYSDIDKIQARDDLEQFMKEDSKKNIDLEEQPFRITLIRLNENKHVMVISYHHIVCDGWSNRILLKQFLSIYEELAQGKVVQIDHEPSCMKELLQLQKQNTSELFWKDYLQGMEENPCEKIFHRDEVKTIKKLSMKFTTEQSNLLREYAKQKMTTLASVFYSIWAVILQRYNDNDQIVFGVTLSGRNRKIQGIEKEVGLLINTLPLKVDFTTCDSFDQIVKKVSDSLIDINEHIDTSIVDLKKYCSIDGYHEIFNSIFVVENYPFDQLNDKVASIRVENINVVETTNYDITLVLNNETDLRLDICYNDRYQKSISENLETHIRNTIQSLIFSNEQSISHYKMLSEQEKEHLCLGKNGKETESEDITAIDLFEQCASANKDHIAVIDHECEYTYEYVNRNANLLAQYLCKNEPDIENATVAIIMNKSVDMIISMIAILKAGASYLPIEPNHPKERIAHILKCSQVSLVLMDQELSDKIKVDTKVLIPGEVYGNKTCEIEFESRTCPDSTAYIIYTSGSTGTPKGVMVSHRALVNYIQWAKDLYVRNEKVTFPLYTSVSVDLTVTSIYVPLITDNTIRIYNCENQVNALEEIKKENKVDLIKLTPSHLKLLLDMDLTDTRIKKMILGGEALEASLAQQVLTIKPDMELYNEYGPTEATVGTICHKVTLSDCKRQVIPVGLPINNTSVYMMDRNRNLLPEGCIGEIYLAGRSLAQGYKNEVGSTCFLMHDGLKQRVYKTGDKGRWNEQGQIEYYGRADTQVKIRGHRIELNEIEWRLKQYKQIADVVVSCIERGEDKLLAAYIVSDIELYREKIVQYLKLYLPGFMIPSYFVKMDHIPLAVSGKVLYKELPTPTEEDMVKSDQVGPRNDIEQTLLQIWSQVIGIPENKIGINDNFFEIGGHSLKVTSMVARIHKQLHVKLNIGDIFKIPTIRGIAEYISKLSNNEYSSIEHVPDQKYYPLSSAQKRIYIVQQLSNRSYNIPTVKRIKGKLDIDKLEKSLQELVNRHEALRTSFITIDGEPFQLVQDHVDFKICRVDAKEKDLSEIIAGFLTEFDLSIAPLFKVMIATISDDEHIFLFDMHHIITDGSSLGIITKELSQIYGGQTLQPLPLQYRDYAIWHNKMKKVIADKHEKYWCDIYKDIPDTLTLLYDYAHSDRHSYEGDRISISLDQSLYCDIKEQIGKNKVTLFMYLLTAFNIMLYKFSQQEDIVVGTPVAGRSHNDLNSIVGMFVNTLALRIQPTGKKTVFDFLNEVKNSSINAFEHQDYQFEDLIEKISVARDITRNPLFDVMFVLQNTSFYELVLPGCEVFDYDFLNNTSKFDLMLVAQERNETIELVMEYCTKLFKKETIQRFVHAYINVLKGMVKDIHARISEIDTMDKSERQKIVTGFNHTEMDYQKNKLLYQFFEEKVIQYPNDIAVISNETSITYSILNERANQVAHYLVKQGIGPDCIVGIITERSIDMMIGILGILKAGAAYLPIDTKCPRNRLSFIVNECKTDIILVQSKYMDLVKEYSKDFEKQVVMKEIGAPEILEQDCENLNVICHPNNLCYVIYTSGSTGNPKGVMIEHASIVNRLEWMQREYKLSREDVILHKTPYTFDVSVWELFLWTFVGAKLSLLEVNGEKDPECIAKTVQKNHITICHFVPSMLSVTLSFMEHNHAASMFQSLRQVITSGEELKIQHVTQFYSMLDQFDVKLANLYGPTEAAVDVTYYNVPVQKEYDVIPIGKPIDNTRIYIINQDGKLADINVPGELCIGGVCLARGYVNQKDLTEEKFTHALSIYEDRLYKTGDKAKWSTNGEIIYIGRLDNQVKIRGNRIELGEIEKKILDLLYIKDVTVVKKNNGMDDFLCAYMILADKEVEQKHSITDIREHLLKELPEYMIPAYYVFMDEFPVNQNGKLDIKKLPNEFTQRPTLQEEYREPVTKTQKIICEIWKSVIKIDRIGINDAFFEVGGSSIQLIKVVGLINEKFHINIPVYEMFKLTTIRAIASSIDNMLQETSQMVDIEEDSDADEDEEKLLSRRSRRNRRPNERR